MKIQQIHSAFNTKTVVSFHSVLFALMHMPTLAAGYFFPRPPEPMNLQKYI